MAANSSCCGSVTPLSGGEAVAEQLLEVAALFCRHVLDVGLPNPASTIPGLGDRRARAIWICSKKIMDRGVASGDISSTEKVSAGLTARASPPSFKLPQPLAFSTPRRRASRSTSLSRCNVG